LRERFSRSAIDRLFGRVAEAVNAFSLDRMVRVPGIDPASLVVGGQQAIAQFRTTNARLIRSVPEELAQRAGQVLSSPEVRGLHVTQARKLLAEKLGVTRSKAEFWARDQTLKLYADVTEERHKSAGIETYRWITSNDEH